MVNTGLIHDSDTITAGKCCEELDKMHQKLLQHYWSTENMWSYPWQQPHASLVPKNQNELIYEALDHPPYLQEHLTDFHFLNHLDGFLLSKPYDAEKAF